MIEQYTPPPFPPQSLEYGHAVVRLAATDLCEKIGSLMASDSPVIAVETKTDQWGARSAVTKYDKDTEQLIGGLYANTGMRIKGEENVNPWADDRTAVLNVHVDPIDGTNLLIDYVKRLAKWTQLPEANRRPRPVCGSMVSAGAFRPGSNVPEWGAIAAPFIVPEGIVSWAGGGKSAVRTEPDGCQHELPKASTLVMPKDGGTVLVASNSSERAFGSPLRAAGYRVVTYQSAVATALCVMDPSLPSRILPPEHSSSPIVGAVMGTAKNWDVAAVTALANTLGHFVSNTHGKLRTFEDGATSAVFAVENRIGRSLISAIAPHLE